MRYLHRDDLRSWSTFDEARNIDFNGLAWIREGGNVLVDPVEMGAFDLQQLKDLGGAAIIVVTNGDHIRDASALSTALGAKILGPAAERDNFEIACDGWLADGEEVVGGLRVFALQGSKTPGELALLLEDKTLITGDLIRGQRGGRLNLLPDAKMADPAAARDSVKRLAALPSVEAVLVGDGWSVFRDGRTRLSEL
ncbi:MAG: MBL fold metallo-hydrolase [Nannocystaceae bacterium]|nr:MBL fold metallo-hydrolase [Nannocystaceae bacterium]